MMLTVGELINQLKSFDPATLVVVPDPASDAESWETGIACWTEICQVQLKPTAVYRPRYEDGRMLVMADAWIEVPAVRLVCEHMEDL